MAIRRQSSAFSLIEVVIAVAIVASGLLVILSLAPGLLRQRSEAESTHAALNLAPAVVSKLTEIAAGNIGNLPGQVATLGGNTSASLCLVAAKDGSDIHVRPGSSTTLDGDQYFLIEPFQFTSTPLAYVPGSRSLALSARVSWPYRLKAGTQMVETQPADRQSVTYTVSLRQ